MTINELRSIIAMVKKETDIFCQDMIPSLDEIGELSIILGHKALAMVSHPERINLNYLINAVGNTIIKHICLD